MKKRAVWIWLCLLLTGCTQTPEEMETGLELRSKLLQSEKCSFTANITADYGDKVHTFAMDCISDNKGDIRFTVTQPESISGIAGSLSGDGGEITFEDAALHFEWITEDQLSPISAPWILMHTLRSGCMVAACREEGQLRLTIDDSYAEDPLRLDIWLDARNMPRFGDILYDGRRILSIAVANFEIL